MSKFIIMAGFLVIGIVIVTNLINNVAKNPFLSKHCKSHIGKEKISRTKKDYSIEEIYEVIRDHYNSFDDDSKIIELNKVNAMIIGTNANLNFILGLIASTLVTLVFSLMEFELYPLLLMLPVGLLAYMYINNITKEIYYNICLSALERS